MEVRVDCRPAADGGQCEVQVGSDPDATSHTVSVTAETLRRLGPTSADPALLVQEAFRFLLAREPRESILSSFELPVIGRYFPEWEREMRERLPPG